MDIRALIMGLAFSLMWSSAFATGRVIVAHAPPLAALSLRFAISAVLAVAVARALGQSWRLAPAQWRGVAAFGLCQNALYLGLNFVALQRVEASLAAIIASSMPLIVALLGWALRGERVAPLGALGLAVGFGGVALIMGTRMKGMKKTAFMTMGAPNRIGSLMLNRPGTTPILPMDLKCAALLRSSRKASGRVEPTPPISR